MLRKNGHFLKIKRTLLCLLQNLGGTCPQCPPGSYMHTIFEGSFEYQTKLIVTDGGGMETTYVTLWAPSTETIWAKGVSFVQRWRIMSNDILLYCS